MTQENKGLIYALLALAAVATLGGKQALAHTLMAVTPIAVGFGALVIAARAMPRMVHSIVNIR